MNTESLQNLALQVWENKEAAQEWLTTPNRYLQNETPINYAASSQDGLEKVKDLIGQISHGVLP